MISYSSLVEIPEFRIGRFDHPQDHPHQDPPLEVTTEYSVSRVEHGSFALEIGRQRWELGPGDLFLNYPGMEYRCRHRELVPSDVCMSVTYAPPASGCEEMVAFERAARKQPVLPSNNRLAYLFLELARISNERMAAAEAAHCVISEIASGSAPIGRTYRQHQLRWYAERMDAVRQHIDRHYASEQRLAFLARSVGMSPFHFARVFRELVGMPPHAYLRRTRLREAARSLREGASVTEACFATGFQNLSHFSRQFYRQFGVKASAYACQVRR